VSDRALISGPRRAGSWLIPWKGRNSQIGVFLGYACAAGRALLDVRLYLPRSWVADRGRCAAAGIEFATKPQLALQMIAAALRAGITTTAAAPTRPAAHRSLVPLPY
jgi:hypothetical protein